MGTVDHIGTAFTDDFVATGFGHHFAMPILREEWRADLTEAEARTLIEKVMRVCYYRDCRTINKVRGRRGRDGRALVLGVGTRLTLLRFCSVIQIQLAKVSTGGALITPPYSMETKWDYESFVKDKAGADTGGSW